MEEEELSEIVKRCMKQLSNLCQQILAAFYYDEKSMQEISKSLGLANEDVAKSKKYQCKKELERLVKKAVG
jgi:DNA-directed RNA polymerase specialized sigma subunit